jgi:hypothetical protein
VIHIPWKDAPATKASSWILAALSNVAGGGRQVRKRVPVGFSLARPGASKSLVPYGIDESKSAPAPAGNCQAKSHVSSTC